MTGAIPDILARIVDRKRARLVEQRSLRVAWETRASQLLAGRRDFRGALTSRTPAVIAEIKKASPSRGLLCADFRPAAIARTYEAAGAAALSVLTDEEFFQGSLADLETARAETRLPALRKDFTLDDCHVVEAAAHGADAILLIAAILEPRDLRRLRELAVKWKMAVLVEVHDARELAVALEVGADIIGVNNRDLHTFDVSLDVSLDLAPRIPAGVLKVSESGIHGRQDVERLRAAGYDAFLVGEHLMRSADTGAALRELTA